MESFTDQGLPVVNEKGAFEGELALARGVAAYRLISKKLSSRELCGAHAKRLVVAKMPSAISSQVAQNKCFPTFAIDAGPSPSEHLVWHKKLCRHGHPLLRLSPRLEHQAYILKDTSISTCLKGP